MDWFQIVSDYLVGKSTAALQALHDSVGYDIYPDSLPHKYDGAGAIVLSKTPGGDHVQLGTANGLGDLEVVSNCYSGNPEDRGDALTLDTLLTAALNETRYVKGETGTIQLAQIQGFPQTFIEPSDTRRAVARRIWRIHLTAVTLGV